MHGKLLEFLRVSSLDPEFLIKCPDQETASERLVSSWRAGSGIQIPPSATDANSGAVARATRARDRLSIRILHDCEKFREC